ncbi:succinate dehydrogenase/fumarate reductase iron-sulfur subunit [Telmatospirillum sp.]|uniref:succinate dehydrogenase/fumarate reductase iron-sulfur subunit n=1 Tax=Telmatospirillum sp. TaxID=2079197 RepID=UPI00283FCA0C|nr:succinate dehydrogenase/fumarate reductase iron-sulfur subunit [Telmatospirillum sp.]MDR3440228.1 succinate dehydrogenase/fumarate reductase iron-sulfur subunit [Telmatospirillum sp.]
MRTITFDIDRFDGNRAWTQSYSFEYAPGLTVLASLFLIKEKQDATLNFTASCRSAICGACAIRVNGNSLLPCDTRLDDALDQWKSDKLHLSPIGNFPVVSDLMVDWSDKIERLRRAKPGLHARKEFTAETGCRQSPAELALIINQWDCILCGCCASECNKLSDDSKDFLEPFVFTHASRYAHDSRSADGMLHVKDMLSNGLWKCLHCMECVSKCPKGIKPAGDIAAMRAMAVAHGNTDGPGPRHAAAFRTDLENTGRLNEVKLVPRTEGMVQAATERMGFTLRMLERGKMSVTEVTELYLTDNKPIEGIEGLRKIIRSEGTPK